MPIVPSRNEEEHVAREELKLRLQRLEQQQHAMAQAEKRRLKDLHWMHCPKCGHKLAMEEYGPVEIDVCPSCNGIWLDANELETILANASKGRLLRSWLKILSK